MNYIKHVLAAGITIALTACGGGGGGSAPASNTSTPAPTTTTPAPTTTTPAPTTTTPAPTTTTPAPTTTNKYAYFSGNGQILQYALLTNGAISTTSLPPVFAGQNRLSDFKIHTSGKSAYAIDGSASPALYQYTIGTNGALQPMATPSIAVSNHAGSIAVHPNGNYLYVSKRSTVLGGGGLVRYAIDGNGALSMASDVSISLPAPSSLASDVTFMSFDPSGQYLYVATSDTTISEFKVGTDFALNPTPVKTITFAANTRINNLIVDSKSRFVSVLACSVSGGCADYVYGINGLPQISTTVLPMGSLMSIDKTGTYAYVAASHGSSPAITSYLIGDDGKLTKPAFGNSLPLPAGIPNSMVIDPTNNNIYVGASSSTIGVVTQFTTSPQAILTQASLSAGISASTDPLYLSPLLAIH